LLRLALDHKWDMNHNVVTRVLEWGLETRKVNEILSIAVDDAFANGGVTAGMEDRPEP
jgi:hypothetical protein